MLYHLLYPLHAASSPVLNVIRYITFRTAAASLTALALSLIARAVDDPQAARVPDRPGDPPGRARRRTAPRPGTPTMGGLLILTVGARADAAVGRPDQPVHLDCRARDHRASARSASPTTT